MTFPVRTVLLLALGVVTILLAIFVIKAALAVALIVALVFAALYIINFARALTRKLASRAERQAPRMLR